MQTKLDLAKIFGIDPNKITDKPATGISVDDGFRVAKRPTIDARFRHGQKSTSHTTTRGKRPAPNKRNTRTTTINICQIPILILLLLRLLYQRFLAPYFLVLHVL